MPDWTSEHDEVLQREIERALPALLALARRLTADEAAANDALQDALERGWRARAKLRDPAAVASWLRTILARCVIDAHRARRECPVESIALSECQLPDVHDAAAIVIAAEDRLELRAALRLLPEADRIALVLHDGEGWTAADVSELIGAGREATYKRIQRARARLLDALSRQGTATRPPASECRFARENAHGLLDGELDEATRTEVQAHLTDCLACPATLQAVAGVLAQLGAVNDDQSLPEATRERLLRLVSEDSHTSP
jgi:RNA polymerase sigma-70 factor (ECF subfamily)